MPGVCVCVYGCACPDGTFKLASITNLQNNIVTITWYSNDMFRYMLKAEFVTLVSF